jgi:xanthine dehydrogenase accessory factor
VRAPIGLDLGGLSAEETALSIMAEVVAARHGRAGGMLSAAASGRIHEVGR